MEGRTDGGMDGGVDGWMDGWMDGWSINSEKNGSTRKHETNIFAIVSKIFKMTSINKFLKLRNK